MARKEKAEESEGLLPDSAPFEQYFQFCPSEDHVTGGVVSTPWTGEVTAGQIVRVSNQLTASVLSDHPEWDSSSKQAHDAQTKKED